MNQGHSPRAGQPESAKLPHAVFVSYSNEDKAVAEAACAALEAENIGCWMAPRDVQGGRPYSGQITQAIREARVLLLILTGAANRSKHGLREVERAAHCQNHLLTFRVEPIPPGDDLAYFREDFSALARGGAHEWNECTLKLNPLSRAPLLFRNRNGWDRQTVVPSCRVLSITQAETAIRGSKAARLYGRPVYELLRGRSATCLPS